MVKEELSVEINSSCEEVFDCFHDYSCRLKWDTMLREARLIDGATEAKVGVRSLCTGTWKSAYLKFETEYISFERGKYAAVRLTNKPFPFERFAATVRHETLAEGRSKTTYIYSFSAQVTALPWLTEPVINFLLKREVSTRLNSLRRHLERVE